MIQRPLIGAGLLLAIFAAACTSPPDGKQKTPEGPQFDADYYAKNAKEYYEGGRYGPAKDQWQKQLVKDPENWMAHLGIAYCDYFMADQIVASKGDTTRARALVEQSEKGFRDLWSGQIEPDTATADCKRPQWRAAIGLAMATRKLGVIDQFEARRYEQLSQRGGPESSKAADKAAELLLSRDRRYQESIGLYAQLARMEHASDEAIKNLGELYIVTKQDAAAEQELKRYLQIAQRTRVSFEEKKKDVGKTYGPQGQECATKLFDEKLASNAEKQVSVMVDLAQLAWDRGDYNESRQLISDSIQLRPNQKDLYLKLAQAEGKLSMTETALMNVNEYLKRSSAAGTEFDSDIRQAMKLKQELEQQLRSRGASK